MIRTKTIFQIAWDILLENKNDYIFHKQLVNKIQLIYPKSKDSIRGSISGCQADIKKLIRDNYVYFKGHAIYVKRNSPLHKNSYNLKESEYSYDSPEKQMIRVESFKNVNENDSIITFASNEGLCVKYLYEKYKNLDITNIELDKEILEDYKKNVKYSKKTNNILSTFYNFYKNNNKKYDLLNYDSISYLSKSNAIDLKIINEKQNIEKLVLTFQKVDKGSRNTGYFSDYLKAFYYYDILSMEIPEGTLNDTLEALKILMKDKRKINSIEFQKIKTTQSYLINHLYNYDFEKVIEYQSNKMVMCTYFFNKKKVKN